MILHVSLMAAPSRKVEWALTEMNVKYERAIIDYQNESTWAPLRAAQPHHPTIPAMEENGFWLTESSAIVQYAAESKNLDTPIYPKDIKQRAQVVQWDRIADFKMGPVMRAHYMNSPRWLDGKEPNHAELTQGKADLTQIVTMLDGVLTTQKYVAGTGSFSMADINFACYFFGLVRFFDAKVDSQRVTKWLDECWARPAFKAISEDLKA